MSDPSAFRLLLRSLAHRELRERSQRIVLALVALSGASYGWLLAERSRLGQPGTENGGNLGALATGLVIALAIISARRIQDDRRAGWLATGLASGALRAANYLYATLATRFTTGALYSIAALGTFSLAWQSATGHWPSFVPVHLGLLLLSLASALVFATIAALLTRDLGGVAALIAILVILPLIGAGVWTVRHDRYPPKLAQAVLFAATPPRSLVPSGTLVLHHAAYVACGLALGTWLSRRVLGRVT